ncbi:hypothetical protein DFH28DRAFT_1093563 [Melampsora americana]|nr:hypothetical protein DFH28DRAFT_1093563 [Melampsora americana]
MENNLRVTAPMSSRTFRVQRRKKILTGPQRVRSTSRRTPDEQFLSFARSQLRTARRNDSTVHRRLVAGDTNADTKNLKYKVPSKPRLEKPPSMISIVLRKNFHNNMILKRVQKTIGVQSLTKPTLVKLSQQYHPRDRSLSKILTGTWLNYRNEYTTAWRNVK